jgi:hypothetical protein|tara:strand:- start:244 stop:402 length:159 start_codon:yes stop_codon:yes gene_type:complete
MNGFMKAIDLVVDYIIGDFKIDHIADNRISGDRRIKKPRKRKNERRILNRRV